MRKTEYLVLTSVILVLTFGFVLPQILIPKLLEGRPYYPLVLDGTPIFSSDELTWPAAEAREVMDGRLIVTDPVVWEHKNAPSLTAQIPVMIIGLLGRFTGSINKAFVLLRFVLPPVVFLTIFALVYLLTKEHLASCLTSTVVMLMTRPFQFFPPLTPSMFKALFGLLTNEGVVPSPVEFFRLPNPLLIFPFLILTIVFLWLALAKKKTVLALAGGFFFGLLFYVYFYFWTFVLAGVGIFLAVSLIQKDWPRVKRLVVFLGAGAAVSLFYWSNFFRFQRYPFQEDVLRRAGIEVGRIGNLIRTTQFLIFGFLFSLLIRKKDLSFWFLLLFLLGGITCLNIQLITGFTFQSDHWTLRVINPWAMIMLGFVYSRLLATKKFYGTLTLFLTAIFLGLGLWIQFSFARKTYSSYTLPEGKTAAFTWLDKNTAKDSVVGSPSIETNTLIPAYTHNNVFLPNGGVTLASTEEIIKRVYIIYRLFEVKPEYLEDTLGFSQRREEEKTRNCQKDQCLRNRSLDFLERDRAWFYFHMQSTTWNKKLRNWSVKIGLPEEERKIILEGYQEFLKNGERLPPDLQLDYLFLGPEEKKLTAVDFKKDDFLSPVYQKGGVEIYQVENPDSLR